MKDLRFSNTALEQYQNWEKTNPKIFKKINTILNSILQNPFHGIGKPEPLKGDLAGYWSRRINLEHRIVYSVTSDAIYIVACRYHY